MMIETTANEKGRQLLADLPPGFLLPGNLVRLQVVRSTDNPLFWKLLNDAGQNAPAPILVNVFQFIRRTTGGDAARCATELFCSGADALVVGNFLLEKR